MRADAGADWMLDQPADTGRSLQWRRMHYLDLTLPTLAQNLALDEALLLAAEDGGPEVLRVWQWPDRAVVLGAGGKIVDDVEQATLHGRQRPTRPAVERRRHGPARPRLPAVQRRAGLHPRPGAGRNPVFVSLRPGPGDRRPGRGRAAARPPGVERRHPAGTQNLRQRSAPQTRPPAPPRHVAVRFRYRALASRYLKPPPRQPEYRRQREHGDFITNLNTDAETLKCCLRNAWEATEAMTDWPRERVARLVEEKYGRLDWVRRR